MALIKEISEIKKFLAIDANTRIESIGPYIDEAEILFLKPLIGGGFYNEVKAIYNAGDFTGDKVKYLELMPFIQRPLINYAFFLASSMYGVSVSDVGIQVNQTTESAPAPQWKIQKIEESWLNTAYTFADVLLKYLEEKAADFQTWVNDVSSPLSKKYYINSTDEFNEIRSIGGSRRTFLALKPFIGEAETLIERLIGNKLHEEVKEQLKNNNLTNENKELLKKIRPVVANFALIEALPLLSVSIASDAILINSFNNGLTKKDAPTEQQLQKLIETLRNRLSIAVEQLKRFLESNFDKYPLYAAHLNYTANRVGVVPTRYINNPDSKNFLIG